MTVISMHLYCHYDLYMYMIIRSQCLFVHKLCLFNPFYKLALLKCYAVMLDKFLHLQHYRLVASNVHML